jgi:hypothetical protein
MRHLGSAIAAASLVACTSYSTEHSSVQHTNHVEVSVYGNLSGAPALTGEPVAFIDPDGTAQVIMTGADGVARADVAPGSSITAVLDQWVPAANPPMIETVLDVRDGDHIQIGFPPSNAVQPTGTGPCAQDTLSATYTDMDASVAQLQLMRTTDTDINYTSMLGATPTLQTSVSGAGAAHAYVQTEFDAVGGQRQWVREWVDGCATSYQLDVGASLVPWVSAPTLDVDHQTLSVPVNGTGAADLVVAQTMLQRGSSYINWEFVAPTGGGLEFPALPPPLDQYLPQAGDTQGSTAAWVIGVDGMGGYAGAHQQADAIQRAADNDSELFGTRMRSSWIITL